MLFGDRFQLSLVVADTLRKRADRLQDGSESRPKRLGNVLGRSLVEAPGRALGQASPEGLDRAPNVVYQLRASIHQRLARTDDRQMSLGVFTPVVQWVKQFRIQTGQACQVLRIYLIGFALVGVDEPQFAGVGHKHLVAALLEYPACPRRVGTGLDC